MFLYEEIDKVVKKYPELNKRQLAVEVNMFRATYTTTIPKKLVRCVKLK